MKKIFILSILLLLVHKESYSACDAQTVLMLHLDGTDASTTFTDSSTAAHTVSGVGNAQLDTAQLKFGTASYLGDGTGDSLTSADDADWDFGTGEFTIDFWVRFAALGGDNNFFSRNANAGNIQWKYDNGTTQLKAYWGGGFVRTETWSPSINTWYHIAIERYSGSVYVYVDGTQLGTAAANSTDLTFTDAIYIAAIEDASQSINGWIDEYRVSKGIGRYSGTNFTPPSSAYCGGANSHVKGSMMKFFGE